MIRNPVIVGAATLVLIGTSMTTYSEVLKAAAAKPSVAVAAAKSICGNCAPALTQSALLRGTPGIMPSPSPTPLAQASARQARVPFDAIRPQVAKLLGVTQASLPTPAPATSAIGVGSSVDISFDSMPQGGEIEAVAWVIRDGSRTRALFSNPGKFRFGIPVTGQGVYLLQCTIGASPGSPPSSIKFDIYDDAGGAIGQQAAVQSGVFFVVYETATNATHLWFNTQLGDGSTVTVQSGIGPIPMPNFTEISLCNITRVR